MKNVKITFYDGKTMVVPENTQLLELTPLFDPHCFVKTVAAIVDNTITELTAKITQDCTVQFLDLANPDGRRIYERSLIFLLIKAVNDLYPERKVLLQHSVRHGVYAEITGEQDLLPEELVAIEHRMRSLSEDSIPIIRHKIPMDTAMEILNTNERQDLYSAIRERNKPYVIFYDFDGLLDYFYGYMVPHSGYIKDFSLFYHYPGIIITYPKKELKTKIPLYNDMPKLFSVFSEYKNWGKILGIENIGEFNKTIRNQGSTDLILIAEALQEKKIAQIADAITRTPEKKKIIFVAGPSSSGKTTFANRLSIQLRVNGYMTHILSMDDYFINKNEIPRAEDGSQNWECPEVLDIALFSTQMKALIKGQKIDVPVFNFKTGRREDFSKPLKLAENQMVIIEGIHGLNPKITSQIPKEHIYKIYVSPLTSLNIDNHNRIPTTDTRLLRRIVRDNQFRAVSALETIRMWPSVRNGEEEYIFPYQESCDTMFNSALIYELGALKSNALPLLEQIGSDIPEYSEANRLIKFLSYFVPVNTDEIPSNSLLKEFLGGSCFQD